MTVGFYDWGGAARALAGETECGDRFVVRISDAGALVAMIDGLGHGHEAAEAAVTAARILERHAHESPATLIERCHAGMHGRRGAAISVAFFDRVPGSMTWLGIGNVCGMLVHADPEINPRVRALLVRGGTVGDRLPELHASVEPVACGDTLILATDGVRGEFAEILPADLEPQQLADKIIEGYAKRADDAAVLVFRYRGDRR